MVLCDFNDLQLINMDEDFPSPSREGARGGVINITRFS